MTDLSDQELRGLSQFVNEQYEAIVSGKVSHGLALYNIALEAERLIDGDVGQAIRGRARVVIGDDVIMDPYGGGEFVVPPAGRLEGSSGFRDHLQQENSAQLLHAVAGLYMTSEYGGFGTIAALAREGLTNVSRRNSEAPDYLLYLAAHNAVIESTTRSKASIFSSIGFGSEQPSLAEAIRNRILDLRSQTEQLRQSNEEARLERLRIATSNSELARIEIDGQNEIGSMGRLELKQLTESCGPRGTGFNPNDPRGPWQDPGIAYTPPGQKPRGWNDPDGHPSASAGQGLGGGKTSQDSSLSSDRHDRNPGKAPPPPLPPKHVPRDTDNYGRTRDDIAFVGAHPILLDLDGDGIEITELDRSTIFMDASGTGLKHRTAWTGKGDGILFYDADNDGLISDDREYIFTAWDLTAGDDLAALKSPFDTNCDAKPPGAKLGGSRVAATTHDSQTTQVLEKVAWVDSKPIAEQSEYKEGQRNCN